MLPLRLLQLRRSRTNLRAEKSTLSLIWSMLKAVCRVKFRGTRFWHDHKGFYYFFEIYSLNPEDKPYFYYKLIKKQGESPAYYSVPDGKRGIKLPDSPCGK